MASELERRGCDLNDPLWSTVSLMQQPDVVEQVHGDYLNAGSDVIITSSYQLSFEGIQKHRPDLDAKAETAVLMKRSVDLALAARKSAGRPDILVACSVGPYGAWLADGSEYSGHYKANDATIAHFHRERLKVLCDLDADLLALETIPCLREARIITDVLGEFPGVKAWLSFSCRDGGHTSSGDTIEDCGNLAEASPAVVAVGVNCTAPQHVESLLVRLGKVTAKPLLCYPNSGDVWDPATKSWIVDAGRTGGDWAATH